MLGDVAIRDSERNFLPFVGDKQMLRTVRSEPYRIKYTLDPLPGFDLAIIGLEKPTKPSEENDMAQHHGERPGKTGEFPEGKLNESDEGSIKFMVGEKDGNVVVDFGSPVHWLGMPPQQAVGLAELLIAKARVVAKRNGEVLTVNLG